MTDVSTHLMFQDGSAREAVEQYVECMDRHGVSWQVGCA